MTITSFDQLPLTLGAEQVAAVLGISRSNAYALLHQEDFPTIRIGKRLLVAKDKFIQWMDESAAHCARCVLSAFSAEHKQNYCFKARNRYNLFETRTDRYRFNTEESEVILSNSKSSRNAKGAGTIRKRKDGRWEGRYIAGHDENGKPIRKNVLGKTQADVRDKLKAAIELAQSLDVSKAENYTVEQWVNTWYELYSKPNIRESTQNYYQRFIRLHIIPHIGYIKLTKLTGRDIQKMYNEVREHGRTRKEQKEKTPGLSNAYVRGMHTMLHNCLDRAVKEKLIPYNPSDDCILPKLKKQEMKILKPEDMAAYLKEADNRGVLPMFFLVLCTGLRRGEIAALLWEDLDMEKKTISINKQAVGIKGGGVKVTQPKTDTSIRQISVSQQVIDLLVQEHEKHPDNPVMFPSPVNGGMWYPDAINRLHQRILKSAGLEHIRLHDLRHPYVKLTTFSSLVFYYCHMSIKYFLAKRTRILYYIN